MEKVKCGVVCNKGVSLSGEKVRESISSSLHNAHPIPNPGGERFLGNNLQISGVELELEWLLYF